VLAASGVVAAFATMAPAPVSMAPDAPLIEALSIRTDALIPAPLTYRREERFQRGDTLAGFLQRLGIAEADIERLKRVRALPSSPTSSGWRRRFWPSLPENDNSILTLTIIRDKQARWCACLSFHDGAFLSVRA